MMRPQEFERSSSREVVDAARRERLRASTSNLAHLAAREEHEVISLLLATGLGTLEIAGSAFLGQLLTSIATTALIAGIQYLTMPKPPKPADGKLPRQQGTPPVIFGVGRCRIAGADMLWEEANGHLVEVVALVGHKVSAITRIYLGEDYVTAWDGSLDNPGGAEVADTFIGDGRYIDNAVWIGARLGEVPETAYQFIIDTVPDVWTTNHRGDGIASLAMKCPKISQKSYGKRFPGGAPRPSAEIELAPVWDFRDPAQDPEDPSTWQFSRNAALCFAWWLCFCPYGPQVDYQTSLLPVIERWKEEADICDEPVAKAIGGTEPRYQVDGWATTETDPVAVLNAFLASCDGHIAQHGDGSLVLTVGKFREALVETVTDADIVACTIQYDVPEEDEINRLVPRFTYPATDYTSAVTDYFESTADQARVGRVLSQEADLSWVTEWRQARRLAKREWLRLQQKWAGPLDLRLSAINAVYARWVRMETPLRAPEINGRIVENKRSIMALMKGGFQMEWKLHPENIDAWDPASDEGAAPPVPTKPNSAGIPVPVIDTVVAKSNGTTVYLACSILDPGDDELEIAVSYRLVDNGSGSPGAWVEQRFADWQVSAGLVTLNTAPVPSDEELEVRAAFVETRGTYGDWSESEIVISTTDTVAPLALTAFSANDGTGQFSANFSTVNDSHLRSVAIYRVPSGGALDRATHKVAQPAVAVGISYSIPVVSSVGSFDIYAEPLNASGIPGPLSGPDAATVT